LSVSHLGKIDNGDSYRQGLLTFDRSYGGGITPYFLNQRMPLMVAFFNYEYYPCRLDRYFVEFVELIVEYRRVQNTFVPE